MTDVELDERVTALEENGGGGNSVNGRTIDSLNRMQSIPNIYFFIFNHIFEIGPLDGLMGTQGIHPEWTNLQFPGMF